ncbi:hypothetical protein HFGIMCCB_00183 [Enterobacteria phage Whisky]|nr:hypothetical protein HFGIMCCB_00183 [Enterobacteria phage Whisky]
MKMIKLIGLAAAFMLTGCAGLKDYRVATASIQQVEEYCVHWYNHSQVKQFVYQDPEHCVIDMLQKKDEAAARIGLPQEAQQRIAEIQDKIDRRNKSYQEDLEKRRKEFEREQLDLKKARKYDICRIGVEAAYQDDLSSAYESGDYEKVQLLSSKEYRYKLRKQCEDILN